jgi:peptidoglycan/LPS O-acetylase OafA/YrhL
LSQTIKYRADIDGLRAVAVLLVLAFHFDLAIATSGGFVGVDVFYVISGFLVTSIIKRRMDQGRFSFFDYYVGRIRRLAPSLFVTLILVIGAAAFLSLPTELYELGKELLLAQFYLANMYYWKYFNYFHSEDVLLLHTWSLAVEEQFYLCYPLIAFLTYRYCRRHFWTVLAVLCAVSFVLNVAFVYESPNASFYLLPMRAWELLLGSLIPIVHAKLPRSNRVDEFIAICGVGLLVLAVVAYDDQVHFPGFYALLPTLGAVFLILSGTGSTTWSARILSQPLLVYIGQISYALYLVHWPIRVYAQRLLQSEYSYGWRIAMLGASFLLAMLLYHLVETPIRKGRAFTSTWRLTTGYAAGLAATAGIFLVIYSTDGLPARFPERVTVIESYANDRPADMYECSFEQPRALSQKDDFCRIGAPDAEQTWLVYGDSHAWATFAVFDRWLAERGLAGVFRFQYSCPPMLGIHLLGDSGTCNLFNSRVAGFLAAEDTITDVILVSAWHQVVQGLLTRDPDTRLDSEAAKRFFRQQFAASLGFLHEHNKRIHIWEPLPGARASVPSSLAQAELGRGAFDLTYTRSEYLENFDYFFAALAESEHLITQKFSPSAVLCASGRCAVTIDETPAYFDRHHITYSTSPYWTNVVVEQSASPKAQIGSNVTAKPL